MSKTVATLPELTNVNVIGLSSSGVVESRRPSEAERPW
jgi:hypothetical protein